MSEEIKTGSPPSERLPKEEKKFQNLTLKKEVKKNVEEWGFDYTEDEKIIDVMFILWTKN
jgi:hypothetical protein